MSTTTEELKSWCQRCGMDVRNVESEIVAVGKGTSVNIGDRVQFRIKNPDATVGIFADRDHIVVNEDNLYVDTGDDTTVALTPTD